MYIKCNIVYIMIKYYYYVWLDASALKKYLQGEVKVMSNEHGIHNSTILATIIANRSELNVLN